MTRRGGSTAEKTNNKNSTTPKNAQYTRGITVQQVNISGTYSMDYSTLLYFLQSATSRETVREERLRNIVKP